MSELVAHALTTIARIKAKMVITGTGFDTVLERQISAVTDFIENECNRRFKSATYTNEIYSIQRNNQKYLLLKNAPVTVLTSLEYRMGLLSTPSWTAFLADDYALMEDGKSGIVYTSGLTVGPNMVRATYTAGYLIDFANSTDLTKHTLPADITDLCERLVIKWFKKKENWGQSTQGNSGDSVTWKDLLEEEDLRTLAKYRRPAELI